MKTKKTQLIRIIKKEERGYTLLEYCAGAAVIAGIVWTGLSALGGSLNTFLGNLGTWVETRPISS